VKRSRVKRVDLPKREREDLSWPAGVRAWPARVGARCVAALCPHGSGVWRPRALSHVRCCARRHGTQGFPSRTSRPIGTAVVWPRAVASLSVEHRRPGDWVSVGKLAVPVVLQCVAGVANASGCAICLLLDRSTVACPHTASAAMRLADDHDGVRGGDEAAGAVWTRKGPLPVCKARALAGPGPRSSPPSRCGLCQSGEWQSAASIDRRVKALLSPGVAHRFGPFSKCER